MSYYVGLDVSLKEVCICVVDADGSVVAEGKVATDPCEILSWIERRVGPVERILHESGPLSIWLTRALVRRGGPVVCIDARAAHKALSARLNKSDRSDAEALAQLARTGWYREVYIKSEASDRLRLLLGARERMIRIRKDSRLRRAARSRPLGPSSGLLPDAASGLVFASNFAPSLPASPFSKRLPHP